LSGEVEMTIEEDIKKRLEDFPSNSAISLVADLTSYFNAMKGVVEFSNEKGMKCIYITSTIPSAVIKTQLGAENVEITDIRFIDCISFMVGSSDEAEEEGVMYIESPTMLENIMLKVDIWLKRMKEKNVMVLLDSVNTLSMHNEDRILQEFLHYIINSMRSRGVMIVVISVEGQTSEDLETILKLVTDETLEAFEAEE
jgi:hypothetical protein